MDCEVFDVRGIKVPIYGQSLWEALYHLMPQDREIILLYFFLSLDDLKISKMIHLSRSTIQQRRKIYALTEQLGWNDNPQRIQGFVKRMTGVDRLEWLNVAQCEKVIEGLKAILKRQERKEGEG